MAVHRCTYNIGQNKKERLTPPPPPPKEMMKAREYHNPPLMERGEKRREERGRGGRTVLYFAQDCSLALIKRLKATRKWTGAVPA